ncbi:MAG: CPBP family intramembrane metalloprotease [Spirochaetaceae bacterium]|nr:CPBP family intramembrane metalloprotease [Spirochaetaceae bacterium]
MEFSFVILLLAVPPLIYQGNEELRIRFTLPEIAAAAGICAGLLLLCGTSPLPRRFSLKDMLLSVTVLASLIAVMLCIWFLSPLYHSSRNPPVTFTTGSLTLFAAGTFISACYEEILYRWYLPRTAGTILKGLSAVSGTPDGDKRYRTPEFVPETAAELLPLLLFAPAHLYLGVPAVINAFIAGTLLRTLVQKTATPFTAAAVHWIYNMLVYTWK